MPSRPDAITPERLAVADDEQLVTWFVDGDERAYAVLLDRYERRVHGICHRYFGDPVDAQDAAQDAFLALYRRASTFRGGAAFSTWMYRVATNACNDIARKQARRPRSAGTPVEDLPVADPTDAVATADLRLDLREALLQLDPDQRAAVVGHSVQGRPYHELAEEMGVAVGTVKSRVHRGHARLAAILGSPEDQDEAAEVDRSERSGRSPPPT